MPLDTGSLDYHFPFEPETMSKHGSRVVSFCHFVVDTGHNHGSRARCSEIASRERSEVAP